jgi:hypothetical protein
MSVASVFVVSSFSVSFLHEQPTPSMGELSAHGEQCAVPKPLTQYRVFIGSPGGLDDERKCFSNKLAKFSTLHAEPLGVLFHPVGWEDMSPAV